MNRPWLDLVFSRRAAAVRILVIAGALVGDLLLVQQPTGARDWGFAGAGLVLCLAAGSRPLAALGAQAVLLVVAHGAGAGIVPTLKVLAAVTLFELAVRRSGRSPVAGAAVLACAVVANRLPDLPGELPSVLYKAGIVAGLPLLLGEYVRVTREHARQQELRSEQRLLAARAAERATIARELHDLVAHHVSSMVLRVGVARHVIPAASATSGGDPRIAEVLDDLHASGSAALADLRRLVAVLRDPDGTGPATGSLAAPGALPAALDSVVERSRGTGLTVSAGIDAGLAQLDPVRGLAVLRLAQEGLANAAKHAGPGARAELRVAVGGDGTVRLTIRDDGAGGAAPPAPGPAGHGLIGMHERVDLLGGRLDAGPAPGRGWLLSAELPSPSRTLEPQA
ncbi:histidine kinase [Kitasatospora sp. NPDC002040]|uniref:sensor histidine kinase n=1 Tax=Kitasatospora sp. NPDC002040 TaxID=3154661 RepID=UPI00332BA3C9